MADLVAKETKGSCLNVLDPRKRLKDVKKARNPQSFTHNTLETQCWFEAGRDDQEHSTAPSVTSGAVGDGPC